jgi:hypothetical protein
MERKQVVSMLACKQKLLCLCRHPHGSAVAMRARSSTAIVCCLGTLVGVYSVQVLVDLLLGIGRHIKYDAGMMVHGKRKPSVEDKEACFLETAVEAPPEHVQTTAQT